MTAGNVAKLCALAQSDFEFTQRFTDSFGSLPNVRYDGSSLEVRAAHDALR